MTMTMHTTTRLLAGLGAGVLLVTPLAACSDATTNQAEDALASATSSASEALDQPTESAGGGATGSSSAGADSSTGIDCSGTSCTLTFGGDGTEVDVLGTTVRLGQVADGQATIGVAGNELTCTEGETVSAGPLTVECTTIGEDRVVLTTSLG